jgi:hypothetical protein
MKSVITLLATVVFLLAACRPTPGPVTPGNKTVGFGDSIPVSNGLLGRVYLLPDTTRHLPDFDTITPLPQPIFAQEINVPWQKWSDGFPGLRDRIEWFGIEYRCTFKPNIAGLYAFRLVSDDGSRLWIDDSLFLDNDGIHPEWPVKGKINLSNSMHTLKLDYFQGPRYELSIQLYWSLGDSAERIFPGKDFVLTPPKPENRWWIWLLAAATVLVLAGIFYKKINTHPASPPPPRGSQ